MSLDSLAWLLLLSVAMLFGSYLAGSLPLTTKLSEKKIRLLNALGAGLLIGTSLMVVIPEGVETIYNSSRTTPLTEIESPSSLSAKLPAWTGPEDNKSNYNKREEWVIVQKREPEQQESTFERGGEHSAIGLALISGFALMFVIDQISSLHLQRSPTSASGDVEYSELGIVGSGSLMREEDEEHGRNGEQFHLNVANQPSMTPTVGLVVHAAADGIALGASVTHPQLSVVVFIAIMLHKAPASFALTSVLLANGLSHTTIRKHLLLFALAAPVGALVTYAGLYFFSSASTSVATLEYWTGTLLVFSGGTFLYVAMHALQEAAHSSHDSPSAGHPGKATDQTQLIVILIGMILPVLFGMILSH